MTNAEMKAALSAKGIQAPSRANAEDLKRLCEANGIDFTAAEQVANETPAETPAAPAAPAETPAPIKIIICGQELEPASEEILKNFLTKKAQREFPDFIGKLEDGEYKTTGKSTLFKWINADGDEVTFLLAILERNGNYFPVGSWDLTWSAKLLVVGSEEPREIKHVIPEKWTRASERDSFVVNVPAGVPVFVHSAQGHWHNPLKPSTREYFLKWAESE